MQDLLLVKMLSGQKTVVELFAPIRAVERDNKLVNSDSAFYPGHDLILLGGGSESNFPSRPRVYAARPLKMIRDP